MSKSTDSEIRSRRDFLKVTGAAVGGAILLPYGCSESSVGVTSLPLSGDYEFFRILDGSQSLFDPLRQITPGILLNDQGKIVFYGDNGDDNYGLYELTMDFSGDAPSIEESRTVVATGSTVIGQQGVRRIHRADLNGNGDVALLLDFYETGSGAASPDSMSTVFVAADNEFNRVAGFGDTMPDGGQFGGAFGDLAIDDERSLLLVSHYASAENEFAQGVFSLADASRSQTQPLLRSGVALQGRSNAMVRGFGLIDVHDGANFVAQTQISLTLPTSSGAADPGSLGGLLQGTSGLKTLSLQPRLLSAPPVFGLEHRSPGEIIMGPRAGVDGAAAWIVHSDDGQQQRVFFRNDSQPETEISQTGADGPIFSFSAPVLSENGALFYLQFNNDETNPIELKMVSSGTPTTILKLGDKIDGQAITGLMHGYHSRQADKEGRIVVYAEFGDGEPAILVGIPS